MGWLGDLWESAKKTASNIYDTVKETVTDWSKGSFLAPGSKFCGPGNPLDPDYVAQHLPSASHSGMSCYQHDKDYEDIKKMKDSGKLSNTEIRNLVRESDDRLIRNLQTGPRDIASYFSELGIRAKKKAEDWGLLSPEKFLT